MTGDLTLIEEMIEREIEGSEDQGSLGWHEARLGRFTGSKLKDLVSITSDKPKSTAERYIDEKVAEIITGEIEVIPDNKYMQRGREMEPVAMDWLSNYLGVELYTTGAILMPWSDRVAVSPDRIGVEDGNKIVIESKSPKSKTHLRWASKGKLPSEHKIQVMAEIMCTEADYAYFLSYDDRCIGSEAFLVKVNPDEKLMKRIEKVTNICLEMLDDAVTKAKINTININDIKLPF